MVHPGVIEHILLNVSQRAVTLLDRSGAVAGLRKHGGHRAVKIGIDLFGAQRKKRVAMFTASPAVTA